MLEFINHKIIYHVQVKRNKKVIGLMYKPNGVNEWVYENIAEGYATMDCLNEILNKLKELNKIKRNNIKFSVFVKDETVMESIYKDFITGVMLVFCIYISQNSTWWTFVTGLMFTTFLFTKIKSLFKKKHNIFKTKKDLQKWINALPDDDV